VFVDGNLSSGITRSIRGQITKETDQSITVKRSNGEIRIFKQFVVKIEDWS